MYTNLAQMFRETSDKFKNKPAFATRDQNRKFQTISYGDLFEKAKYLSAALIDLGVKPKDHVGLFSDNRQEWILSDIAILLAGAADVPRGSDVTDGDITYILPHADVNVLFVENSELLKKIERNKKSLPDLKTVILMDKNSKVSGDTLNLYDLIEKGKRVLHSNPAIVENRIKEIKEDDLFTLIYTSGTTGTPKGVMLTHKNMISQVNGNPISISSDDRVLSILPVWHIFERVFEMIAISAGACTYYTNIRNFKEDLQIVKPTFMASAPRLWESVYQGIMANIEKSSPIKKNLFKLAYLVSSNYHSAIRFLINRELKLKKRNILLSIVSGISYLLVLVLLFIPNLILDTVVLSKIRNATGGVLRGSCSGGGALPLHVDEFFNNIGIPVLEGYGMTETSPVISVRTFNQLVIGTVGPLYGNTQLRLIDINTGKIIYPGIDSIGKKGEIHIKGDQVMRGYYKNPEATSKVLKDGWMNTGDLGMMTFNGCLKIVGRSKETIVLLGGENVEPVPVENKLLQSPFIDQCMLVGQDKKNLAVLIVPKPEKFKDYGNTLLELSKNDSVQKKIGEEIKNLINSENGFKSFERIQNFRLLPKSFEAGDELSAKLSLKRHIISEKYKDLIEEMYA